MPAYKISVVMVTCIQTRVSLPQMCVQMRIIHSINTLHVAPSQGGKVHAALIDLVHGLINFQKRGAQ